VVEKKQEGLSRRDFITGAAVGAVGGMVFGTAGSAMAATVSDWIPAKWDYEADAVVIGYGFAGQATAIEAARAGSSVIILEKMQFKERGGNSRVCGQGMLAPPQDLWDPYFQYLKEATEGQGLPTTHCAGCTSDDTLHFYVEESAKNHEWFEGLGFPLIAQNNGGGPGAWIPFFPTFPGADAIAAQAQYWTTDPAIGHSGAGKVWYNLEDAIAKLPLIKIMYKSPAKRLVQNPLTREVLGVVITQAGKDVFVKAKKGVAVCGGGYEFSYEMMRTFQQISHLYSQGSPSNTGETIKMAAQAGAALRNMAVIAAPTYMSAGILPGYKGAIPIAQYASKGGFIMVGRNNKRFRDEYSVQVTGIAKKSIAKLEGARTYSGQEIVNGQYVKQSMPMPIHYIFDQAALVSGPLFGSGMSWADNVEGYKCSSDNSAELANGWIIKGNDIRDLATKIGRNPDELAATVAKWNADCAAGKDTQFDTGDPTRIPYYRTAARLVPIASGPVYAVQVYQCTLNTQGGMVRNLKSQVMDTDDKPIPRLYAAGENGDIWTVLYQCMSNVGGGCFGYGRVAGQQIAAQPRWDATVTASSAKVKASAVAKAMK
jgi:succinate dehydrogenase/fumarate reductase flavoprotein subunit